MQTTACGCGHMEGLQLLHSRRLLLVPFIPFLPQTVSPMPPRD